MVVIIKPSTLIIKTKKKKIIILVHQHKNYMKIKFYQLCVRGQNYNVINTFEKTHILKEMIFLLKKKV